MLCKHVVDTENSMKLSNTQLEHYFPHYLECHWCAWALTKASIPVYVPAEGIWLEPRCTFHWWEFTFKRAWQRIISGWICRRCNRLSEQRGRKQREALHCLWTMPQERRFLAAPVWLKRWSCCCWVFFFFVCLFCFLTF